jgi:hypothetical protein
MINKAAEIKYNIFSKFDDISNKKAPYFLLFLNIANILSVTKKPPTTLIVARITPITEKIVATVLCILEAIIIAPTITTPDIAFEPDMRGVCNVGGTLVITS